MKQPRARQSLPGAEKRERVFQASVGVLLVLVAMLPQIPFVKWTLTHGLHVGFGSGRSAILICWTGIMLVCDLIALLVCLCARPQYVGFIVVMPVALLIGMFVAVPLAYIMRLCIQIMFL